MYKKTLISLAVASSLLVTGCFEDSRSDKNAGTTLNISETAEFRNFDKTVVRPVFNPNPLSDTFAIPAHYDLLYLLGAGRSADFDFTPIPTGTNPAAQALEEFAGFSTSSAFNVPFNGELNPATVAANQSVFLVPLNTKPVLDVAPLALPPVNPAQITGVESAPEFQPNFRATVVSQNGGFNNAIRITPLEPLENGRKYIVVVTNNVLGANGKNIDQSIESQILAGSIVNALAPFSGLVNAFNTIGTGFLRGTETALSLPEGALGDVALAYTFTTEDQSKVLRTMASPAAYLETLGQKVGFTALFKAVRDTNPRANFTQITGILGRILAGDTSAGEDGTAAAVGAAQAQTQSSDIQAAIGQALNSGAIPFPTARPSFFYSTEKPANELATIESLESGNPIKSAANAVRVSQGAIALPYYQPIPAVSGGESLISGNWTGDTNLETVLNNELGNPDLFRFLRDGDGTLNVNSNYPYPQVQGNVAVPVVAFYPVTGGNCDEGIEGVTIFQHGITVDRSTAMLPGILLAAQDCQAVIAIDQPLHGLAGATAGTVPGLDVLTGDNLEAVKSAFSAVPNLAFAGERHFNFTDAGGLVPVEKDSFADVSSGSLFINLKNLLGNRDNLRQGVYDLLNLSASIDGTGAASGVSGLDITGDGSPDLADKPVHFVGHSLGGITGSVFASLSNDPAIQGGYAALGLPTQFDVLDTVVLHNTGGQITRLIENSVGFSQLILPNLPPQGTSDLDSFLYIFQSVLDTVDPVVYAKSLGASTNNILISQVVPDFTVPNEANVNPLGSAYSSPLAGTEPLMALLDLGAEGTALSADGDAFSLVQQGSMANEGMLPAASFFAGDNQCSDANHGTFVGPVAPNSLCPDGVANTSAAFAEMVRQTILALNGAPVLTDFGNGNSPNLDVLGQSNTLEQALDQDK